MLSFSYAQLLYLDSSAVNGATEVAITKIDLYFRAKPPAIGNKSGIERPGVEVLILPTKDGLPVVNQIGAYRPTEPTEHGAKFAFYSGGQTARREWDEIIPSINGSVATTFLLDSPALVKTDKEYSIVVKFDGDENFILWKSVMGQELVDGNSLSPGPSSPYIGPLYQFINPPEGTQLNGYGYNNGPVDESTQNNAALIYTAQSDSVADITSESYLQNNWSPIPSTYLKFDLYVAKYSHNGRPLVSNTEITSNSLITNSDDHVFVSGNTASVISNNVIRLYAPTECQEYIIFDKALSVKSEMYYGEPVYQDGPAWPNDKNPLKIVCYPNNFVDTDYPASKIVRANGAHLMPNGATFDESGGFYNYPVIGMPMIVKDANNEVTFTYVENVISNTEIVVSQDFEDLIANATFSFAPVAFIGTVSPAYVLGKSSDLLLLYESFVKEDLRFVSKSLKTISVANSGTGYSNTDYVRISGYEHVDGVIEGNFPAFANISTDGSGAITNVYFSNTGAGFVNVEYLSGSNVEILTTNSGNPTNTSSSGTGAVFDFEVGSVIKSAFTPTKFENTEVVDLDVIRMKPEITVNNPVGTGFTIKHRSNYYRTRHANTSSGFATFMNTPEEVANNDVYVKIFKSHALKRKEGRVPVIPSRSNQVVTRFANGHETTPAEYGDIFSNSAVYLFDISSNSDYQAVYIDPEIVVSHYSNYVINREYTNEHTNFGKAWAKHITKKVNFKQDRYAENLLVYLVGYKPAGTDFKVYARLHNSQDPEEFDDKDWTLMNLTDGHGLISSSVDSSDFIELEYNLPIYPNTEFTFDGSVTIYQGNSTVVGSGTTFLPSTTIHAGGTGYSNGEIIRFNPTEDTIPSRGIYALNDSKSARGVLTTNSSGGITSITINDVGKNWQNQSLINDFSISTTGGSGANVSYRPGLAANDYVKIYSPLFSNTNYVIAVVDNVINNTSFQIKKTLGDLDANSQGTVSVNTTSTTISGTNTQFTQEFSEGDFIAVWANSSVYEVRRIDTIVNSTSIEIDTGSNFTFAGSGLNFAYVTSNNFNNTSITVDGLLLDKLRHGHQAFNDVMNKNVCKYYNMEGAAFNSFDTFQIKVVMLSEDQTQVPKIDSVRGIGASA